MTTTIKTKAQANKIKYKCLVVPTKKDKISHIIVMNQQTEKVNHRVMLIDQRKSLQKSATISDISRVNHTQW